MKPTVLVKAHNITSEQIKKLEDAGYVVIEYLNDPPPIFGPVPTEDKPS